MKKLSYLLPLLFIFCCVQQNKYTPFIDIQLLNGIKVGDHKNKIQSYLGEPLIIFSKEKMTSNKVVYKKQSVVQILMDSNAQEIWEYHYRYRQKLTPDNFRFERGGVKRGDDIEFSDITNYRILLVFNKNILEEIIVDN